MQIICIINEMSTFEGIVSEVQGLSIDRFDNKNLHSRVFLLSHCHKDHMQGINDDFCEYLRNSVHVFLYVSEISSVILENMYPDLKPFIVSLSILKSHKIRIPAEKWNEEVKYIDVTLIPAGHCPGSVMFLIENENKFRVLYTGDFRITVKELSKIKALNLTKSVPKKIHKLYFDSTFWNENYSDFPSRDDSCDIICDLIEKWISKGSNHVVYLNVTAHYGSEYLYMEIYKRLRMPVHISQNAFSIYSRIIDMDGTFTLNPKHTQIHSCEWRNNRGLKNLKCLDSYHNIKIRHIRPSAMAWRCFNTNESDICKEIEQDKFCVCYSSHCSYNELKNFIEYLKPESIEPCVVKEDQQEKIYSSINDFCKYFLKTSSEYKKINEKLEENTNFSTEECSEESNFQISLPSLLYKPNNFNKKKSTKLSNLMSRYQSETPTKSKKIKLLSGLK